MVDHPSTTVTRSPLAPPAAASRTSPTSTPSSSANATVETAEVSHRRLSASRRSVLPTTTSSNASNRTTSISHGRVGENVLRSEMSSNSTLVEEGSSASASGSRSGRLGYQDIHSPRNQRISNSIGGTELSDQRRDRRRRPQQQRAQGDSDHSTSIFTPADIYLAHAQNRLDRVRERRARGLVGSGDESGDGSGEERGSGRANADLELELERADQTMADQPGMNVDADGFQRRTSLQETDPNEEDGEDSFSFDSDLLIQDRLQRNTSSSTTGPVSSSRRPMPSTRIRDTGRRHGDEDGDPDSSGHSYVLSQTHASVSRMHGLESARRRSAPANGAGTGAGARQSDVQRIQALMERQRSLRAARSSSPPSRAAARGISSPAAITSTSTRRRNVPDTMPRSLTPAAAAAPNRDFASPPETEAGSTDSSGRSKGSFVAASAVRRSSAANDRVGEVGDAAAPLRSSSSVTVRPSNSEQAQYPSANDHAPVSDQGDGDASRIPSRGEASESLSEDTPEHKLGGGNNSNSSSNAFSRQELGPSSVKIVNGELAEEEEKAASLRDSGARAAAGAGAHDLFGVDHVVHQQTLRALVNGTGGRNSSTSRRQQRRKSMDIEDAHLLPRCPDDCRCSDAERDSGRFRCATEWTSSESSAAEGEESRRAYGASASDPLMNTPARDLARFPAIRPKSADDEDSSGSPADAEAATRLALSRSTQAEANSLRQTASSPPPSRIGKAGTTVPKDALGQSPSPSKRNVAETFARILREDQERKAALRAERSHEASIRSNQVQSPSIFHTPAATLPSAVTLRGSQAAAALSSPSAASPELNTKWKGFGGSPLNNDNSSAPSPTLSDGSARRRNAHQRTNTTTISLHARVPAADADAIREKIELTLGGTISSPLPSKAAARAPDDSREAGVGLTPRTTSASLDRRSVRFSPRLEYHSATPSVESVMDDFAAHDNSFSREMRSMHEMLSDLSKTRSSRESSPINLKAELQEPTIDLSALEVAQARADETPVSHILPRQTNLQPAERTPQPPGYFQSTYVASPGYSRHVLVKPRQSAAPSAQPDRLLPQTSQSDESSDASAEADRSMAASPRASTPPPGDGSFRLSNLSLRREPGVRIPVSTRDPLDGADTKRLENIKDTLQKLENVLEAWRLRKVEPSPFPAALVGSEERVKEEKVKASAAIYTSTPEVKLESLADESHYNEKLAQTRLALIQKTQALHAAGLTQAVRPSGDSVGMTRTRLAWALCGICASYWGLLWLIDARASFLLRQLDLDAFVPLASSLSTLSIEGNGTPWWSPDLDEWYFRSAGGSPNGDSLLFALVESAFRRGRWRIAMRLLCQIMLRFSVRPHELLVAAVDDTPDRLHYPALL